MLSFSGDIKILNENFSILLFFWWILKIIINKRMNWKNVIKRWIYVIISINLFRYLNYLNWWILIISNVV